MTTAEPPPPIDDFDPLLFGIRRSVRYHTRRRRFFERWSRVTNYVAVLFSSAAIYALVDTWGTDWTVGMAALVSGLSGLDLVVGTARMAWLHESLARRFVELERRIIRAGPMTDTRRRQFTAARLRIEADEPPPRRWLDVLCHNELCRAIGAPAEDLRALRWHERVFAQFR